MTGPRQPVLYCSEDDPGQKSLSGSVRFQATVMPGWDGCSYVFLLNLSLQRAGGRSQEDIQ